MPDSVEKSELRENYILKSPSNFQFESSFSNVAHYVLDRIKSFSEPRGNVEGIINGATGESFRYGDIERLSRNVGIALHSEGFRKNDIALYSSQDASKLHIFLLGVWRIGGIARASHSEDHEDELVARIRESNARWIFCDEGHVVKTLQATSKVPWKVDVVVSTPDNSVHCDDIIPGNCHSIYDFLQDMEPYNKNVLTTETNADDIALILQSGRSGKGVVYTHERLMRNIMTWEHMPLVDDPSKVFLLASRLTQYTGGVVPLGFLAAGNPLIIHPKPTVEAVSGTIETYKVAGLMAFPKFLQALANTRGGENPHYDTSSLKVVAAAMTGQVIEPTFVKRIKTVLSVESLLVIYGMTEVGVIVVNVRWMGHPENRKNQRLDECPQSSCGTLMPGTHLCIRDLKSRMSLSSNRAGEIVLLSPFACVGYFKDSEETAKLFEHGWLRTGHFGSYDNEGFIFRHDRQSLNHNQICPNKELSTPLEESGGIGISPSPDGEDTRRNQDESLNNNNLKNGFETDDDDDGKTATMNFTDFRLEPLRIKD